MTSSTNFTNSLLSNHSYYLDPRYSRSSLQNSSRKRCLEEESYSNNRIKKARFKECEAYSQVREESSQRLAKIEKVQRDHFSQEPWYPESRDVYFPPTRESFCSEREYETPREYKFIQGGYLPPYPSREYESRHEYDSSGWGHSFHNYSRRSEPSYEDYPSRDYDYESKRNT